MPSYSRFLLWISFPSSRMLSRRAWRMESKIAAQTVLQSLMLSPAQRLVTNRSLCRSLLKIADHTYIVEIWARVKSLVLIFAVKINANGKNQSYKLPCLSLVQISAFYIHKIPQDGNKSDPQHTLYDRREIWLCIHELWAVSQVSSLMPRFRNDKDGMCSVCFVARKHRTNWIE